MNKNICILIRSLVLGGSEKQSVLLAEMFKKHGYNVFFAIRRKNEVHERFLSILRTNNIPLFGLKNESISEAINLYCFFRENKIRILVNYLPIDNLLGTIIGKLSGIPIIIGGIRNAYLPPFKKLYLKILCNYFNKKMICNNYEAMKLLKNTGFNMDKIVVIHNFIDEMKNRVTNNNNKCRILTVGRFVEQKNYETALKSIKYLTTFNKEIDFEYKIIGHGHLKNHIERLINEMDISNFVILHDSTTDIFEEYLNADIYLSTSLYEGLSNSIMEAASFGLPIVTTNVGDNKYIVKHNMNGYLCSVGDYKQIAKYLYLLLCNKNLCEKMALEGVKNIKTNFGREKFTNSYLKLIKQL